ncbi:hypothetical protein J3E68DRAFT_391703 [Trichoderma sp. SZMC 28012]
MWMDQSTPSHEMPQGRGVVCMHQDRTSARGIFVKYTKYSVRSACYGKWDISKNSCLYSVPNTIPYCTYMLCSHLPSSYHGRSISTSCNARELADMPSAIDLTAGPLPTAPIHTGAVTAMSLQARVIL